MSKANIISIKVSKFLSVAWLEQLAFAKWRETSPQIISRLRSSIDPGGEYSDFFAYFGYINVNIYDEKE